jgi:hypothetical protein
MQMTITIHKSHIVHIEKAEVTSEKATSAYYYIVFLRFIYLMVKNTF